MTHYGVCEKCHQPVVGGSGQKHREPAFPVTGWEVPRTDGGTNHIRNRDRIVGRVRHVGCLPDPKVSELQGSLL